MIASTINHKHKSVLDCAHLFHSLKMGTFARNKKEIISNLPAPDQRGVRPRNVLPSLDDDPEASGWQLPSF